MPLGFIYERLLFEDYKVAQIASAESIYIQTNLPKVKAGKNYFIKSTRKIANSDDTRVIIDLLNLRKKLSDELFERFCPIEDLLIWQGKKFGNDRVLESGIFDSVTENNEAVYIFNKKYTPDLTISEKDLNHIIVWCIKNGFPYSIRELLNSHPHLTRLPLGKNGGCAYQIKKGLLNRKAAEILISFDVWGFLLQLHIFSTSYMLFNKVILNSSTILRGYTQEQCEETPREIYGRINIKTILNFKNTGGNPTNNYMTYTTNNIFDLALYSLFLFRSVSGNEISQCPICLEHFVKKRKNQKYCRCKPCEIGLCDEGCNKNKYDDCKRRTCYPQKNYKRNLSK